MARARPPAEDRRRARNRREPTPAEAEELQKMFADVPTGVVVARRWSSEAGQAFVKLAHELRQRDVAVRYMVQALDASPPLDERVLLQVLEDYKRKLQKQKG